MNNISSSIAIDSGLQMPRPRYDKFHSGATSSELLIESSQKHLPHDSSELKHELEQLRIRRLQAREAAVRQHEQATSNANPPRQV